MAMTAEQIQAARAALKSTTKLDVINAQSVESSAGQKAMLYRLADQRLVAVPAEFDADLGDDFIIPAHLAILPCRPGTFFAGLKCTHRVGNPTEEAKNRRSLPEVHI